MYKGSILIRTPFLLYTSRFSSVHDRRPHRIDAGFSGDQCACPRHLLVVSDFHYIVSAAWGSLFSSPPFTGIRRCSAGCQRARGTVAWAILFTGFNLFYFPMFILDSRECPADTSIIFPIYKWTYDLLDRPAAVTLIVVSSNNNSKIFAWSR